jgi:hypothetical protein
MGDHGLWGTSCGASGLVPPLAILYIGQTRPARHGPSGNASLKRIRSTERKEDGTSFMPRTIQVRNIGTTTERFAVHSMAQPNGDQ